MPWPQTGATHYHAQLGLPDKGRAIIVLVLQWLGSRALEPANRSGPRFFINRRPLRYVSYTIFHKNRRNVTF